MPNLFTKILKFVGIGTKSDQKETYPPKYIKLFVDTKIVFEHRRDTFIIKNDYQTFLKDSYVNVLIRNIFMNMNNPTVFIQEFQFEPGKIYNASSSAQYCTVYAAVPSENELLLYGDE